MRSNPPFFLADATEAAIDAIARTRGRLSLYCGAGVTIDRTGHSWPSLIRSAFPDPMQSSIAQLDVHSPEQFASSLVHVLRETVESKHALQAALRTSLRRALYGNPSRWQRGELVNWIIRLAFFRAVRGLPTTIVTTNYDDYLEQRFEETRNAIAQEVPALPGLRVQAIGHARTIRKLDPIGLAPSDPGAVIDLVYLHGRLPRTGRVSWPLVLDENSYAATAADVERTIAETLDRSETTVMVGTSLGDTPLIRALSATRQRSGARFAVLTRGQFANPDDDLEILNLTLARARARELNYTPLFPDFNGQAAQLITETAMRTAFGSRTTAYTQRLGEWWDAWSVQGGRDTKMPQRLREIVTTISALLGSPLPESPLEHVAERHQLELWVRVEPAGPSRSLTRWARSLHATSAGVDGKTEPLDRSSYLAPVRALVEGRASRLDVEDLEHGRVSSTRYTWRSFLCVPIRVDDCIVGVVSLASSLPLCQASMNGSEEATAKVVAVLLAEGTKLLTVRN